MDLSYLKAFVQKLAANKKIAVLLVDIQNDFCPEYGYKPNGSLAVTHGNEVVPVANELVKIARELNLPAFASRDWHPAVTNHFIEFGGIWPPHCVQNTLGGEFHADLDLNGVTIVSKAVNKDEDAYSAFQGKTEDGKTLEQALRENSVQGVIVVGLATDFCDKASAIDAKKAGFDTYVLLEGCRAVDNINYGADERTAIGDLLAGGVEVFYKGFKVLA